MKASQLSVEQRNLLLQRVRERRVPVPPEAGLVRRPDPGAPVPLSFAQQRLWLFDQLFPGSPAYNIPLAVQIVGRFPVDLLRAALTELIARHESLRTTFRLSEHQPCQFVMSHGNAALPVVDLTGLAPAVREAVFRELCHQEALRPFDLAAGPLLRSTILRLTEERQILMLVLHHIVADFWSFGVLIREMTQIYDSLQKGRRPSLPELPIQYPDFAHWQQKRLYGERLAAEIERWKADIEGAPTVLALPTDQPRPPVFNHVGFGLPWSCPAPLAGKLRSLGQQEGATLFMALLAIYSVLLARYSSQEQLLVGSPIANRTRIELEGLIGFFVDLLVVRADLTGRPSFRDLLRRIRERCVRAFSHQDLPFQQLVDALGLERDLSREALVQATFGLQDLALPTLATSELQFSPVQLQFNVVKYDLSLDLSDDGEALRGNFSYSSGLFEEATVARLGRHFTVLLEGSTADPERAVWDLPILTEDERQQLLAEHGRPQIPVDASVTGLLAAATDRQGSAPAAVWGGGELTYGELAARAGAVASALRSLGVGPEVLVGLFLERSPELLVAMAGVLAAGGACLLLDPGRERSWLERVLERSGVALLLTRQRLVGRLPEHGVEEVLMESLETQAQGARVFPSGETLTASLAFVVSTSGAWHSPRLVGIEHRAIAAWVEHWRERLHSRQPAWLAGGSALDTADGAFDLVVPLCLGGCVLLGNGLSTRPDVLSATPSELATRLRRGDLRSQGMALRSFGEPLRPGMADHLRRAGFEQIYDSYSSAVGGVWDWRAGRWAEPEAGGATTTPVAHVLDLAGEPVPAGVVGELWLSGSGLARGYAGDAERTAQRFLPDRFGFSPGGRLVRTGDLARRRPDGSLELLGAREREVEVRGRRFHLGSIEKFLTDHPGVLQAVAKLQPEDRAMSLVAYAMAAGPEAPDAEQLRYSLQAHLPEPQVPQALVVVTDLPLAHTGRVDLMKLPRVETAVSYVAPRSETEATLERIWCELLGAEEMGVTENFFRRGGHSLLAALLMSRIEQELGVEVPLNVLFQTPTIEGMSRSILETSGPPQPSVLMNLQPLGKKPPLFFIHPVGGNVLCYRELAELLGADRPFFGLEADEQNPDTIEGMAERYVTAIRGVQQEGPYFLGGWSLGGVMAFEMARQLLEAGQAVALIAMVDAPDAEPEKRNLGSLDADRWFLLFAADLLGKRGNGSSPWEQEVLAMAPDARLSWLFHLAQNEGILSPKLSLRQFSRWLEIFRKNYLALSHYRPCPMPGHLTFLRCARREDDESGDPTRGWSKVGLGGVTPQLLPGNHYSILKEPYLLTLVDKLKISLENAGTGE